MPTEFGGSCSCEGGCELSDQGPWQEAEWARPPAWAVKKEAAATAAADAGAEKKEEAVEASA